MSIIKAINDVIITIMSLSIHLLQYSLHHSELILEIKRI